MKILFFILIFPSVLLSQNDIQLNLKDSIPLKAEKVWGVDTFGTIYASKEDDTFFKQTKDTLITYTNYQLGNITSANAFNPLRINLFYQDFNTVIILDNRLAEISKIDFNTQSTYKNVTHVSTGFSNTLWLYNQDKQYLELYDYLNHQIKVKTVPIQSQVLDLKSDYNFCYLLTEKALYVYNYFGSLEKVFPNEGYEKMAFSKTNLILKGEHNLALLQKNKQDIVPVKHPEILINQFLVTNESLYIYNSKKLIEYQLKIK